VRCRPASKATGLPDESIWNVSDGLSLWIIMDNIMGLILILIIIIMGLILPVIIMPDELYGLYGLIQMDYHYLADELSFS
jgi:hypothetical protein